MLSIQDAILLQEQQTFLDRHNEAIAQVKPYEKQLEAIRLTKENSYVALFAGNQLGKSWLGCLLDAFHLTGEYPSWYDGIRFDKPSIVWATAVNPSGLVDSVQFNLFGGDYDHVTACLNDSKRNYGGMIPLRCIVSVERAHGDKWIKRARVRHVSGGVSEIEFRHYGLGRERFQARACVDWIHADEEAPFDIWREMMMRQTHGQHAPRGILTFTPLLGKTELIAHIFEEKSEDGNQRTWDGTHLTITVDDPPWWFWDKSSEEAGEKIRAQHKARFSGSGDSEARLYGKPVFGLGVFFDGCMPEKIRHARISDSQIPSGWRVIHGMDFGFNDPTALVRCLFDPENQRFYVQRSIMARECAPAEFVNKVRMSKYPMDTPVAWPHDGARRDKGGSDKRPFVAHFKENGLNTLPYHVKRPLTMKHKIAQLMEIKQACIEERFFICEGNHEFEEEWRGLHNTIDGSISDGNDHMLDAMRVAWVMRARGKMVYNQSVNGNIKSTLNNNSVDSRAWQTM